MRNPAVFHIMSWGLKVLPGTNNCRVSVKAENNMPVRINVQEFFRKRFIGDLRPDKK